MCVNKGIFMTHYLKIFVFSLFLILGTASTGQAQEFTQAGADEVKAELQDWLERQLAIATIYIDDENALGLKTSGEVTVTPENGYYAAKLPFVSYDLGKTGRFDIGQIAANIIPAPDNKWRITVSYPKTMDFYDPDGSALFTVNIGKQRFGGVWDVEKNVYIRYEGAYEDITVRDTLKRFGGLKIGDIRLMQDFQPTVKNPELYSGPMNFEVSDISLDMSRIDSEKEEYLRMNIGKMYSKNDYQDMELIDMKSFEKDMQKFIENPEENMSSYFSGLGGVFGAMPNSGTSVLQTQDVSFQFKGKGQDIDVKMDKFVTDVSMDGLKTDVGAFGFAYEFQGLTVSGVPEMYKKYLPEHIVLDVNFDNIPMKKLGELIQASMTQAFDSESGKTPEQRQQMLMITMMSLPQLLTEQGTVMTIEKTKYASSTLQTHLSGHVRADAAAVKMAVGEFVLKMVGLDTTIQAIQTTMNENPEMAQKLQGALMGLTMAQSMGQLEQDGKTRTYKFELTADGKMMLNGTDMQGLMGARAH
jgi:hypothetical protein